MLFSFIIYFIILFSISYYAYRCTNNLEDYLLGGRRLGPWTSALSAGASDMSGWLLLGLPGFAYLSGLESFWLALGLIIGTTMNWFWIAKPLRIQTERFDSITIPDYLGKRFNTDSRYLKLIAALLILFFYIFYTASGLVAAGKLFESVFAIPYSAAVISGTCVIAFYTSFGGYLAVSWTDLFQGLLMLAALFLLCLLTVNTVGSTAALLNAIEIKQQESVSFFMNLNGEYIHWTAILSLMAWGMGYFGQPHILNRFMSISSASLIPLSRNIAIAWTVLCLFFAMTIGIAANFVLPFELQNSDSERVILELIPLLFSPLLAGMCLAAILAAIMSTVDSQLLIAASTVSSDLSSQFVKHSTNNIQQTLSSRIIVLVCALCALLIALNNNASVLSLVSYAWGGFGATFGPLIIISLYWTKVTYRAAIAGMLTGGLGIIIFKQYKSAWFDIYELLPAFILSTITIYLVSLLDSSHDAAANKL